MNADFQVDVFETRDPERPPLANRHPGVPVSLRQKQQPRLIRVRDGSVCDERMRGGMLDERLTCPRPHG
ncbi:hypothetical protein HYQ46_006766 [Verticillium longisporum]|nr:hypothetical protein HYQ46_006766 [Verticillium longisporum]